MPNVSIPNPLAYVRQRTKAFRALGPQLAAQQAKAQRAYQQALKSGRNPRLTAELKAQIGRIVANRRDYAAWIERLDTANGIIRRLPGSPTLGEPIEVSLGAVLGAGFLIALATGMYVAFSNYANEGKALDVRAKLAEALAAGSITPEQYTQNTHDLDRARDEEEDKRKGQGLSTKLAIGLGAGVFAALAFPEMLKGLRTAASPAR